MKLELILFLYNFVHWADHNTQHIILWVHFAVGLIVFLEGLFFSSVFTFCGLILGWTSLLVVMDDFSRLSYQAVSLRTFVSSFRMNGMVARCCFIHRNIQNHFWFVSLCDMDAAGGICCNFSGLRSKASSKNCSASSKKVFIRVKSCQTFNFRDL